jgi:hypothetical protein
MIIAIDIQQFLLNNFFLMDTKRNIIMDGNFTKLMYSTEHYTMNGIYITFPIDITTIDTILNKKQMKFNPYSPTNLHIIQEFAKFECKILEYYRQLKQCNTCTISNLLSRQLYSGFMKIYKEYNLTCELNNFKQIKHIIKISGIWQTNNEIGLTYKLYESTELIMPA